MIFSPRFVRGLVGHVFPDLRKTQRVNLGLAVFGQILSQTAVLSQMVREVPGAVKHKHRLKRLWRFVSNFRVRPERLAKTWIPWVVRRFAAGKYVTVALDWTGLRGNLMCLTASLVVSGRAIPLLWRVVAYRQIKDSTNRIEQRLVARLVNLIPPQKRLVLAADRGFGRAEFLRFLLAKNLLFVIRVDKNVWVKPEGRKAFLLSVLAQKLAPQVPVWHPAVSYRADGAVANIALAAVVAKDSDDPWFLATNLRSPVRAVSVYAARFQIEEGFKDMKHALGLEKLQTGNMVRVRRLMLTTAVSTAVLMLAGRLAFRMTRLKSTLITGGKHVCSRVWLAIQIVRRKLLGRVFWSRVRLAALGP